MNVLFFSILCQIREILLFFVVFGDIVKHCA